MNQIKMRKIREEIKVLKEGKLKLKYNVCYVIRQIIYLFSLFRSSNL